MTNKNKKKDPVLVQIAEAFNTTYEDITEVYNEVKKITANKPAAIAATYGRYRKEQVQGLVLAGTKAVCLNVGAPFIKRAVRNEHDCDMLDIGQKHSNVSRGATWIRVFDFIFEDSVGNMVEQTGMRFDADVVNDDIPLMTEITISGTVKNDMMTGFKVTDVGNVLSVEDVKGVRVIKVSDIPDFIDKVGLETSSGSNMKVAKKALVTGYALAPTPGEGTVNDKVEIMSPEDPSAGVLTVWTDLQYNFGLTEYTPVAVYGQISVKETEQYGTQYTLNAERLIFKADEELAGVLEDIE